MLAEGTRWHTVDDPRVRSLAEGKLVRVRVAEQPVLFVRVNGKLAALLDRCPHQFKSMADGTCENGLVVCPWHRFAYDPFTGAARAGMTANATVYQVREEEGRVQVGMPYTTIRIFGIALW